jgi:hypothetical protein
MKYKPAGREGSHMKTNSSYYRSEALIFAVLPDTRSHNVGGRTFLKAAHMLAAAVEHRTMGHKLTSSWSTAPGSVSDDQTKRPCDAKQETSAHLPLLSPVGTKRN